MPRPLLPLLLLIAACLLHLPAHLGDRTPLPQDNPAVLRNPDLAPTKERGLAATLGKAWREPGSAWASAGDVVGRTRRRPLESALYVTQRALFGDAAGRGIPAVSLLLHVLVAWQTIALLEALGGQRRAALAAGLLVLATPAGLAVVDWPARQGIALAGVLGVAGLRLAASRARWATAVAGLVLAAAGLAHEAAFALVAGVPFVRSLRRGGDGRLGAAFRESWPALIAPAVAGGLVLSAVFGGGGPGGAGGPAAVLAGAAGALEAGLGFLLPARLDLAACRWNEGTALASAAVAGLAVLAFACVRAGPSGGARLTLAALASLISLPVAAGMGAGRPGVAAAYLATPLLAAAVASITVRPAGRVRLAGAAACALLLGAFVAGTLVRAGSFRTSSAFVEFAVREAPGSAVARSWALVDALRSAAPEERAARFAEILPAAMELAESVDSDAESRSSAPAARVARVAGAVGTVTVAESLAEAAVVLGGAYPEGDRRLDDLLLLAKAAVALRPDRHEMWVAVAVTERRRGALQASLEACLQAVRLAPEDLFVAEVTGGTSVALGQITAADHFATVVAASGVATRELPVSFRLVWVRALLADGGRKVLTASGTWIWRFDEALQLLLELDGTRLTPPERAQTDELLRRTYVQWGDLLVEKDRPALARLAYGAAARRFPERPEPREHLAWLDERLRAEEAEALAALDNAQRGHGNVANALLGLGVVFCRKGDWKEADEVFRAIESQVGGVNPPLRLQIAIHRHAALPSVADQTRARVELERVLREAPGLARARLELARVLARLGEIAAAHRTFLQAAEEGVAEEWGLDALEEARELEPFLAASSANR